MHAHLHKHLCMHIPHTMHLLYPTVSAKLFPATLVQLCCLHSFFLSGSCAYYLLGYSVVYYMTKVCGGGTGWGMRLCVVCVCTCVCAFVHVWSLGVDGLGKGCGWVGG